MLAALLCGLGLPSPRAREPLFASTSAVQRESRGKDGGAFAEIQVEWCCTAGVWTQGDTIRDETSGTFTTHYDGFGWYGTLKTLRAGRMYVVTSAEKGILTYAGEGECV